MKMDLQKGSKHLFEECGGKFSNTEDFNAADRMIRLQ